MSNGLKCFVAFSLGAAVGSVAAWRFLKSKYEQMAREEIDEVREYYRQKEIEEVEKKQEIFEYETLANSYTQADAPVDEIEQEGGSETMKDAPYIITPEEFAADDEYEAESLTLYACGTLTDDFDNPIEDVEGMVGDALDHFGEFEDDSVFVRNDRYKCNYEILKDVRTFANAQNRILNLVDDDE